MIILDTNVLSEPVRPTPSVAVLRWLDAQDRSSVYTTAITQAEMLAGIAQLPAGRRKNVLSEQIGQLFSEEFLGRVLAFDGAAAEQYPAVAAARMTGKPKAVLDADAQIAAIARAHGARIATRDVRDFARCGVEIINPWAD